VRGDDDGSLTTVRLDTAVVLDYACMCAAHIGEQHIILVGARVICHLSDGEEGKRTAPRARDGSAALWSLHSCCFYIEVRGTATG